MSDKKIIIQGKVIDYGEMSDTQIVKLFNDLLQRQSKLQEKVENHISENRLAEIDINNLI